MMKKSWGMQTTAIHVGEDVEAYDVAPAIHVATTYRFSSAAEAAQAFETEGRPIYTRWGNPTITMVEEKVAALEGGEAAIATASGMAAVSAALLTDLEAGDHVVATTGLYSGTYHFITEELPRFGIAVTLAEATDPLAFKRALRPKTRVIYLESPGNPTLSLNDLAAIADLGNDSDTARERGIRTIVDNTFATPYNQRPLDLGIDVVLHSATKFLVGHGDALGGVVVGPRAFIERTRKGPIRRFGGCMAPFNAWLIARGIQTFPLRMARHNQNALRVAEWLADHSAVAWVRYPWHPAHPQHTLARQQMPGGGGGVVVFELKGGLEAGARLLDRVKLCTRTVSLGDARTLITHPASTTHHSVPRKARLKSGITDGLVRFAVGLEDVEDIIADLDQALQG
jgi:cystathionine beta-lyase/cystathionine gamma-synthase